MLRLSYPLNSQVPPRGMLSKSTSREIIIYEAFIEKTALFFCHIWLIVLIRVAECSKPWSGYMLL